MFVRLLRWIGSAAIGVVLTVVGAIVYMAGGRLEDGE